MTHPASRLESSRRLATMLMLTAERVGTDFAEAAAPFELPVPLARTLLVMSEPMPMRELAAQLACEPSYVTGLADQLEALGLAARVPGSDRRVKYLVATQRGAALRSRLQSALFERSVLSQNLDDEQRDALAELLEHILGPDGMRAVVAQDPPSVISAR